MDEPLKELVQKLAVAINESLTDSEGIADAIAEIKKAGYDVFLIIEATVGFNKKEIHPKDEQKSERVAVAGFTKLDDRFLKALKIGPQDPRPDSSD